MHALALGLAIVVAGEAAPSREQTPMQLYSKEIASAETTGNALNQFDQAASVATDEGLRQIDDKVRNELAGWICEPSEKGIRTSFLVRSSGQTMGVGYSVLTSDGLVVPRTFMRHALAQPLTERQREQYLARKLALETFNEPCSNDYNTVVLRGALDSIPTWDVYLIPASEKRGMVLVGGFMRYRISSDGTRILSQRKYTNSCLELSVPPASQALFVTHLLDQQPTEVHVYLGLSSRKDLFVTTVDNGCLWTIEKGKIRFVQVLKGKR